ncbi:hypothetical protein ABH926_005543 [Catenulispora sp. GP43]|uniref:ferritin-like domain-containing protein n=1 Tax=Catenulispora sp. GP43 TaxID=3156263 RepID=UPI0035141BF2
MSTTPSPVPSVAPLDVQLLQTAAALENLAAKLYTVAAGLSAVASGQGRLRALTARNLAHHTSHAAAFNQAVVALGGAEQHAIDARYTGLIQRVTATKDPVSLATLLEEVEDLMAQTFARFAPLAGAAGVRSLFVDTASVEAQHGSELLIVLTPPDGSGPGPGPGSGSGTAGIPRAVYPTAEASAVNEGAVR